MPEKRKNFFSVLAYDHYIIESPGTAETRQGTQRYLCQNMACAKGSFLLDYHNRGCLPEVKHTIIDMSLNASGVRDTARVLRMSTDTVLSELEKKEAALESVNTALLRTLH